MADILLRADCLDYEKGCWRTLRCPAETDLVRLAYWVLASFGADGSHMMEMRSGGERFVMFPEDLEEGGEGLFIGRGLPDERFEGYLMEETRLGDIAREGNEIRLLYDFSCGHEFLLTVLEADGENGAGEMRILDGEGRGILEETLPKEERRALEKRLAGEGCVLKDALGKDWDPLDAKEGLDSARVLARAEAMAADFYSEDE